MGKRPPMKADRRKPRMSLFPLSSWVAGAMAMTYGAIKYSAHNYIGMRWSRPADASLRHKVLWLLGEDFDRESGLHHLSHDLASTAMLLENVIRGEGEDDRGPKAPKWVIDMIYETNFIDPEPMAPVEVDPNG